MEAAISLQATCYLHAARENFAEIPTFEYVVLVKTKSPKVQTLETTRTKEDFGRLGDLIQVVDRAVESNIFYPVENPLNCSTCSFCKECRQWTGPTANSENSDVTTDHLITGTREIPQEITT